MVLIKHKNAEDLESIYFQDEILDYQGALTDSFWRMAERFPEELIVWYRGDIKNSINFKSFTEIFLSDRIMASYSIICQFIPDTIGYIDQLPFVNLNRKVKYPTWLMSADVGGIKGETLLKFKSTLGDIKDFNLLINSIAKIGQQNGLFCYSHPGLIKKDHLELEKEKTSCQSTQASTRNLFSFIAKHYNKKRLFLLLWCYIKYEKSIPFISFINSLRINKIKEQSILFSSYPNKKEKITKPRQNIDVIIPSLGRPKHLLQVMRDLSSQSYLPKKIIVVEQNPDPNSESEIPELKAEEWPFQVMHHFTHDTGACKARNLALDHTESEWIFFADDDNRMEKDILEKAMKEVYKYSLDCLTLHYPQKGETRIFDKMKQWGTFGAGNSIVSREFASKIRFDSRFEYGYGEDKDYGMQLRNEGCDIIYHPDIEILHLKAPRGGFREKEYVPWENDAPKPSPTLMLYARKYYNKKQIKGFKEELLFRYYTKQKIKNPLNYYWSMKARWRISEFWADKLEGKIKPTSKTSEVK